VKILYAKAFSKDLESIEHHPAVKKRLLDLIEKLKTTESLEELAGARLPAFTLRTQGITPGMNPFHPSSFLLWHLISDRRKSETLAIYESHFICHI
jgi:hypothetical protein